MKKKPAVDLTDLCESMVTGMDKYELIRWIGQGTAGSVSVYRNKFDAEEYALKEIDMTFLNEKDKKNAQNEV